MDLPPLHLSKGRERRLRSGHPWIYSNEVDTTRSPLNAFAPGDPVAVLDHRGRWLAWAYVNPHSLICARVVSRDRAHPLDRSLLVHRIKVALGLRRRRYPTPHYRLFFAESDGMPGLVVDRYGDHLVAQLTTAGMERRRQEVVEALDKVLRPAGILLRNDTPVRALEGLEAYVEVAAGDVPEEAALEEGGVRFIARLHQGQKTGWYYDQAANRERLLPWVGGARVLDLFSHAGGWGVRAAVAGAAEVLCVDQSARALEDVARHAELNGVAGRVSVRRGDAFDVVRDLRQHRERFDVVVVDPPAFIKRRKDLAEGTLAYRRINEAVMPLLNRDGLLVTSSCSYHMTAEHLLETVHKAARHRDRRLQLIERGGQGPDHPVHPAVPETAYLKTLFLRVLPAS